MILALLAVASSRATIAIMAAYKPAVPTQVVGPVLHKVSETRSTKPVARAADAPRDFDYEMKVLEYSVTPQGAKVAIKAKLSIIDRRQQNHPFMWSVFCKNLKTGLEFETKYDQQIFVPPAGELVLPSFSDVIELEAGRYQVTCRFYEIQPGTDVSVVDTKDARHFFPNDLGLKEITIP